MSVGIQLTTEQQAAVENRGGELLVSAAAGSGKTRVLVERLMQRVEQEGLDVDRFLIITFTKAAASELRGKILQEINRRLAEKPEDRHLRRQLTLVYRTQISTIHAFCTTLLREYSHLLDLEPDFRVGEDEDARLLLSESLDRVLEARYAQLQPEDDFARLVDTMSAGRDDSRLKAIALEIYTRIQAHPDPEGWLREQSAAFDLTDCRDALKTPWGGQVAGRARQTVEYWRGRMVFAIDQMRGDEVLEKNYSPGFCDVLDRMDDFLDALERDWDAAHSLCEIAFPKLKAVRKTQMHDEAVKEQVKDIWDKCKKQLQKLKTLFFASNATVLEDMERVRPGVQALFRLVLDLETEFTAAKRRRHMVDFNDLEHLTLRLLRTPEGEYTSAAQQLRERYAEVMVDEYQDTNAVQNAIFDAVTRDGVNLFQVGDIKQSIYRFRLADPTIFLHKYDTFVHSAQAREGQSRKVVLSRNFRSRPSVLKGVNFLFEHIMSEGFGEMNYDENHRLNPGFPYPDHPDDRVELDVVDLAELERAEDAPKVPKDEIEAEFVAKRVGELLVQGYPVTAEDGTFRPVEPKDIAILYRSPGSVMPYLTAALDRRRIPWQAEGADDYFNTTEVSCAISFLEIIDNPRQDVPLLSVLRSPMYAFTPDELAALRAGCPDEQMDLYTCLQKSAQRGEEKSKRFLDDLSTLRMQAADTTCQRLLWRLYDETEMLALFGAMEGGPRRREHLLALHEWARSFRGGHQGLFDFLSYLHRLQRQGGRLPAISRQTGSGVQIMSVHRSKGLEFPVVVLGGLNRNINRKDEQLPMLFHPKLGVGPKGVDNDLRIEFSTLARKAVQLKLEEETKAEELRLLYVAMTRAREKLIMTLSMDDAMKELSKLVSEAGPHPEPQALREKDSVAKWILLPVLARTDANALRFGADAPTPISAADWDIRLVPGQLPEEEEQASKEQEAPIRTQEELPLDWLDWRYPWQKLANLPSKVTATQLKGRILDLEAAEQARAPLPEVSFPKPRFYQESHGLTPAQKGTVLHSVMELIDLTKAADEAGVQEELARLVAGSWLTEVQAKSVKASMVSDFYASALGQAALHSPDLRREFKFSLLAPADTFMDVDVDGEQIMLQGVVDCCFSEGDGLTIVDFKTDRIRPQQMAEHSRRYQTQLDSYTWAVEQIFDRKVKRRVLWYFALGQGYELPPLGK